MGGTSGLGYVGAAYAVVWAFIFMYALRLTFMSRKLAIKLEELERGTSSHSS